MTTGKTVGVLALQGSVTEHLKMLQGIEGVTAAEVRNVTDLAVIDGLVIPGGESTTMRKLLDFFEMRQPLKEKIENGLPVWGTCAGMILLANEIMDEADVHLGVMDMAVRRNAYGSQLDSFSTCSTIPAVTGSCDIPLVFIRAPWIERTWGECEVLHRMDNRIVAARQGNMLATSFHPELTNDDTFHRYFCEMIKPE